MYIILVIVSRCIFVWWIGMIIELCTLWRRCIRFTSLNIVYSWYFVYRMIRRQSDPLLQFLS